MKIENFLENEDRRSVEISPILYVKRVSTFTTKQEVREWFDSVSTL